LGQYTCGRQDKLKKNKMKGNKDMKPTSHLKLTIVPWVRGSIRCPPLRRVFLFVPLLLACFAVSRAVLPPPDGGYSGQNTAEGKDALFSLTTGEDNTALGFRMIRNDGVQPLVEEIL
jgi:hypothetical protein